VPLATLSLFAWEPPCDNRRFTGKGPLADTISHYTIVRKLGSGGMGDVYLAQDSTLRRPVAIKLLPRDFASDPSRKRRFLQEAHAASALSHPNIGVVYEIGETDEGDPFIAMEYIEGSTLDAKIAGKPMALTEILDLVIEIAEALDEAHGKGVTHRDIKPSNLMVTPRGHVKVVDFGLAKRLDSGLSDDSATNLQTEPGMVIGTAAYMSPEQALGAPVDHRTDLFSLGTVLYEMITGRLPFNGRSVTETIDQIRHAQPDPVARYNHGVPPELERILRKLHEKSRENRYQSARELEVDLRNLRRDSTSGERIAASAGSSQQRRRISLPIVIALGVALLALAGAAFVYQSRTAAPAGRELRLQQLTYEPGLESEPALSKDGKYLAYTSDQAGHLDIYVIPTAGGQAIRVTDNEADDAQPSWSPDGSKIAFVSARDRDGRLAIPLGVNTLQTYVHGRGGDIFIAPALGGAAVKLVSDGYYPSWSPDGSEVVYSTGALENRDLWVIAAGGGEPRRLVRDVSFDYQAAWSPNGKWIAYAAYDFTPAFSLRIVPAAGGTPRTLLSDTGVMMRPVWSADGRTLLFSRTLAGKTNLWKLALDRELAAAGSPERVTLGDGSDIYLTGPDAAGRLAFATIKHGSDIWELTLESGALRQVTAETVVEDYADLSPDGRQLALISTRNGQAGIWTADLDGRLLSLVGDGSWPRWSPDGKMLLYTSSPPQQAVVHRPGEMERRVIARGLALDWSPDGRQVLIERTPFLYLVDLETGTEREAVRGLRTASTSGIISPDGKRIFYQANDEAGIRQIWSAQVGGSASEQVTKGTEEISHPRFRPGNPDQLVLLENHKNLLLHSLSTGESRRLTDFTDSNLTVDYPAWSPDGTKIYFTQARNVGDVFLLGNY